MYAKMVPIQQLPAGIGGAHCDPDDGKRASHPPLTKVTTTLAIHFRVSATLFVNQAAVRTNKTLPLCLLVTTNPLSSGTY